MSETTILMECDEYHITEHPSGTFAVTANDIHTRVSTRFILSAAGLSGFEVREQGEEGVQRDIPYGIELIEHWLARRDYLKRNYEKHGLVGLVTHKSYDSGYTALLAELTQFKINSALPRVEPIGLGKQVDVIFERACLGQTSSEIAAYFGVPTKTLSRYCSRHGIELSKPLALIDIETDVVDACKSGLSMPEMVAQFGFSQPHLRKFLAARGLIAIDKFHKGHIITHNGYTMVANPVHPQADSKGYVRLHRLIMEQHLGRYLSPAEHVHHKDGNKQNNDIANLEVLGDADHKSHHARRGDTGWGKYHRNQGHNVDD